MSASPSIIMLVWVIHRLMLCSSMFLGVDASGVVFHFNYVKGDDSICMEASSKVVPCKSLSLAKEITTKYKNDLQIEIESDSILGVVIEFHNVTSIVMSGKVNGNNYSVLECSGNAGISVKESANITLQNLWLVRCNVYNDPGIGMYALAIINSKDVLIIGVNVTKSPNTAIHMVNCTGPIHLWDVTLHGNGHEEMEEENRTYAAGINIVQNRESARYDMLDCQLINNSAPSNTSGKNVPQRNIGYGGAMYVHFGGTTNASSLSIKRSSFIGNTGLRGAGLYVYFKDKAKNSQVSILNDSSFSDNCAVEWGGALSIGFNDPIANNEVTVSDCILDHNIAKFGAGMSIFSDFSDNGTKSEVLLNNCHFLSNHGSLSSALDIAPKDPDQDRSGFLPEIKVLDCVFEDNYLEHRHYTTAGLHSAIRHHIRSGVIIVTKFNMHICGNTTFLRNNYSALVIVSATVECKPGAIILFLNNTGYDGGALALYGFSKLTLNRDLSLTFRGNHALNHGGAIVYRSIDQHSLISGKNCFFQHKYLHNKTLTQTTRVVFEDNTADVAGNSIYSDSFANCYYQCIQWRHLAEYFSYSSVTSCLGNFTILPDKNTQFVSSGRDFIFCHNFTPNVSAFPGQKVKLRFKVVDDFNQTVKPLMSINQKSSQVKNISVSQKYSLTTSISPKGEVGAKSNFTFTVVGMRQIYFYFHVTLRQCPPGFYHDSNRKVCKCSEKENGYSGVIGCVKSKAKIKYGLWAGYIPSDNISYRNLYFSPCDTTICDKTSGSFGSSTKINLLPCDPMELSSHVCAVDRKGLLCGQCSNGSTYYHSRGFRCHSSKMCHIGLVFYFLSEIAPMILFFLVVVTLDLSLTSGASVGFIFFTQYLDKLTVHINEQFTHLRTPYRLFYGLFNFEYFNIEALSFCPWEGSQIMDVLILKYVTIALALCLVFLLVGLLRNNYCAHMCRLRKQINASSSVVHGLSAFLVICYAQSSRTTFYVLRYTSLTGFQGKTVEGYFTLYGGLSYLKGKHLWYAVPAFCSLIFITTLPPLILIMYPLTLQLLSLCNLSEHWVVLKLLRVIAIHRFVPFIDCFQSCYRDKFRCFAGLYFVYRIIILVCFTIDSKRLAFHVNSEIALVIFLGIHCLVQPYKKRLHNILDSLIFVDLAVINGIEILTEQLYDDINVSSSSYLVGIYIINSIQLVLLYLPMIVLLSVGFLRVFRHASKKMYYKKKYFQQIAANDVLDYVRDEQYTTKAMHKQLHETSGNGRYGSMTSN